MLKLSRTFILISILLLLLLLCATFSSATVTDTATHSHSRSQSGSESQPQAQSHERPNFIIMLVDDMGFGDLGCFGNTTVRTPNIDSMANSGVQLNQLLVASPICSPSRAALLTGRYPIRSGMDSNVPNFRTLNSPAQPSGLPVDEITLAEQLKDAGYATGMVGKWHLGINNGSLSWDQNTKLLPRNHGFDSYYGMAVTNVQNCHPDRSTHHYGSLMMFLVVRVGVYFALASVTVCAAAFFKLVSNRTALVLNVLIALALAGAWYYTAHFTLLSPRSCVLYENEELIEQPVRLPGLTQRYTARATAFIKEQNTKQNPFFLYMAYTKVHTALFTHPTFANRSGHGEYVDNVEELDWSVGEILRTLKDTGLDDNTFIFFTSDNGPFLERGLHGGQRGFVADQSGVMHRLRGGKGQNWDAGIRVPGIVRWPRRLTPHVTNQVVSTMDMFTTAIELAGAKLPSDRPIDGQNMMPILDGSTEQLDSVHKALIHYCGPEIGAIRMGRYKMHYVSAEYEIDAGEDGGVYHCEECCPKSVICPCGGRRHDPPLLFDLQSDPSEANPLSLSDYSEVVARMKLAYAEQEKSLSLPHGGEGVPNQLERFAVPWLQPCRNPPLCIFCKECTKTERQAHIDVWQSRGW
jgi:steryl-sulfatase